MNKKYVFFIKFSIMLFVVIIFTFPTVCFSAYPKLVSTLVDGFETIKDWIIRIATPAAAVAVRHRYFYEKI